jgi:hypothetical protein
MPVDTMTDRLTKLANPEGLRAASRVTTALWIAAWLDSLFYVRRGDGSWARLVGRFEESLEEILRCDTLVCDEERRFVLIPAATPREPE